MSGKTSGRIKQKRRAGEPWVSNNRVLNGHNAKKNGNFSRNPNFDTDETKLLIQLWGDPKLQRTLITTHKKHAVICQLATKMQEYGYYRSPEEITTRIKNLKCFYNRLKKDIESELSSPVEPTWKHFAEMDAIMTRPIFSVRPNEVPAPSLKYQLEQAREERQERRKQILREGGVVCGSDDDLEDIIALTKLKTTKHETSDGFIPDIDVDIDISDETFAAIANAAKESAMSTKERKTSKTSGDSMADTDEDIYDNLITECVDQQEIKNENDESNESFFEDQTSLHDDEKKAISKQTVSTVSKLSKALGKDEIVSTTTAVSSSFIVAPKEEPIDVDADSNSTDIETPSSSNNNTESIPKSNMTIASSSLMEPMTSIANCSIASTAHTSSTQSAQGKISLVPTNFLMQPKVIPRPLQPKVITRPVQPQQIRLLQNMVNSGPIGQIQQRILLSGGQQNQANSMKVILVNSEQNTTNQICATSGMTQQISSNCSLGTVMPLNSVTALQQLQHQLNQQKQQNEQVFKQQTLGNTPLQQKQQQQRQRTKQREREKYKREELMSKKDFSGMRILLRQLLKTQKESNDIQKQRLAIERERLDFEKSMAEKLPPYMTQHQQTTTTQMRLNPPKLVFTTAVLPPDQTVSILTPTLQKGTQHIEIPT